MPYPNIHSCILSLFTDNPILRKYPLDSIDHLDCSNLYHHNFDHNHSYNDIQNNYFKIKTETKQELVDDIYYIVYDASELLNKEQNGAHISEWVKLKIKFLDNIEMIVDKNGLTIKVGKKEFIFSESGFFDGTEKA